MAQIKVYGLAEIKVTRSDDHPYPLVVTLKGEDDATVQIVCDHLWSTAEELNTTLASAASEMAEILAGWQDTPEDDDGWITDDRGGYYVALGGTAIGTFPTRDIAEIRLAEAMVKDGYFPNTWYQNDRGNIDDIGDTIRALHDEGGDGMKPLVGVEYEEDAEVMALDRDGGSWRGYVVRDYGQAGVVYHLAGDDREHHTNDRSELRPSPEEDA